MSGYNTITSIDIGSSKIRTVIGYFDQDAHVKGNFHILGLGVADSNAIRKGNILDMEEFKNNLDKSLSDAEKMAGEQVVGAYISFNSSTLEVAKNKGVVAVVGGEVSTDDVDRALDMSKNGIELPNREILKVIPDEFIVDLEEGVKNPIGMSARKLEVVANVFSMNSNVLNNIRKAIADVGIEIYDIYPNLLSSSESILTKRQKELGTVCIDIGASTTGISVYEEGALKYSSVIAIGGDSVTNDIALGLRTSTGVAEKLKLEYAQLDLESQESYTDTEINLSDLNIGEEGTLSLLYLSQIVTARYEEIFYFVREELRKIGKDGMLPEGAVCIGGATKIKGFVNLGKKSLKLPTFIGLPKKTDGYSDAAVDDPVYASVLGTLLLANQYSHQPKVFALNIGGFMNSLTSVFKKILP